MQAKPSIVNKRKCISKKKYFSIRKHENILEKEGRGLKVASKFWTFLAFPGIVKFVPLKYLKLVICIPIHCKRKKVPHDISNYKIFQFQT